MESHLACCPTCPPLYAALVGVRVRLEGLHDPDTVVEERIVARIREHLEQGPRPGDPPGHEHAAPR